MTRLTLRQHRTQLLAALALMTVIALILIWTRAQMTAYLDNNSGLSGCIARGGGCDAINRMFQNRYGTLLTNIAYLNFLPMLIGVFWGAPLVAREIEQGTQRLAWTQSVSRRRWLMTKLGVFLGASILAATLFSFLLEWWFHPFARVGFSRMDLNVFDFQGIVPIAYTVYAFAIGTAAGAVIGRTVPAMAVTFAAFLPVRLLLQSMRAHFITPLQITYQASSQSPRADLGDWVLSSQFVGRLANPVSNEALVTACPATLNASKQAIPDCMNAHGFHTLDIYQPDTRFWTFQGIETAAFLAITVILLAFAVWWTLGHAKRRRTSHTPPSHVYQATAPKIATLG
jgi:hypothetical protein